TRMILRLAPWLLLVAAATGQSQLAVYPSRVTLDSALDQHRLVAQLTDEQGLTTDVTAAVTVQFDPVGVAELRPGEPLSHQAPRLVPLRDGETTATLRHNHLTATVKITVRNAELVPAVSYRM